MHKRVPDSVLSHKEELVFSLLVWWRLLTLLTLGNFALLSFLLILSFFLLPLSDLFELLNHLLATGVIVEVNLRAPLFNGCQSSFRLAFIWCIVPTFKSRFLPETPLFGH